MAFSLSRRFTSQKNFINLSTSSFSKNRVFTPRRSITTDLSPSEIIESVRQHPSQFVKIAVSDLDGVLRGKYIAKEKFLSSAKGTLGVCSVIFGWDSSDLCYEKESVTGWEAGYPDFPAKLDLQSYRNIPWEDDMPFFMMDVFSSNDAPLEACPRQTLKRVISNIKKDIGYDAKVGVEFEWFNFSETPKSAAEKNFIGLEPLTPGMFGYSVIRSAQNNAFFQDLLQQLRRFKIPLEGLHTETGPGVYEAAILFTDALEAADRGILFKTAVKEIAHKHQIMPSFMAKPSKDLPGCSGHLHESLHDPETGKNLFHDDNDIYHMSKLFKHFVAGQLYCLPHILPLLAPNVNSYKRLVDGYWAPTKPTWGIDNRTVAVRVLSGSAKSSRLEMRVPGSDTNTYLAIAASLAAGAYGVKNKLELTAPVKGSGYLSPVPRLPRSLIEATEQMKHSPIAAELLGKSFVEHFVLTREHEWEQFRDSVTQWELKRYFEII